MKVQIQTCLKENLTHKDSIGILIYRLYALEDQRPMVCILDSAMPADNAEVTAQIRKLWPL